MLDAIVWPGPLVALTVLLLLEGTADSGSWGGTLIEVTGLSRRAFLLNCQRLESDMDLGM
jgi:hypothetical protein